MTPFPLAALPLTLSALLLTGCLGGGGSDDDDVAPPQMTREHDERAFVPVEKPIAPLAGAKVYQGIYEALQGEAAYAMEVPADWDGRGLIMYTHGYVGEVAELPTAEPPLPWRMAVLEAGYAWASSSYSANYYDARAGVEDTNKLALEVMDYVLRDYGEQWPEPEQYLISGFSMGGHIAAAAVDKENMDRTAFKVPYAGAAPFCQSEQNQFQWLGDYPRVLMELSGYGDEDYSEFQTLLPQMLNELFPMVGGSPNWLAPRDERGERLYQIAQNLTGGERPLFEYGFASPLQHVVLGTGGSAGDINGILARNGYGNQGQIYRWTTGSVPSAEEVEFNDDIERISADEDANPLRNDGVRWIPLVNGEFDVPVLTMHTLGDFYVPFRHQQLYRERAEENGNENLLVQRAIRAAGHCDFSPGEIIEAVDDWLVWVNDGPKPAGDEVLDADVVADDDYGCAFTRPFPAGIPNSRGSLPACSN